MQQLPRDRRPDLATDLKYLRKGRGLTLDRLMQAEAVVRACGGADLPAETLLERLLSAIRSMLDARGGKALWAAYGLDGEVPSDLDDRRAAYAARVDRKPYTVREWEDQAIDELALRLLSAFYAGSPTPSQLPMPHGGFLIKELRVECFIKDRRFVESYQTRTLISLVEGAKGFIYGTYSPTILSDPENCTVTLQRVTPNGVLHEVRFLKPLHRGQACTFSFREQVPSEAVDPELPTEDLSGQTFESPALRYKVIVHFDGVRPRFVWAYDKLSRIERPGIPEEMTALTPDAQGLASADFADLYGGLCSGVAWRWDKT